MAVIGDQNIIKVHYSQSSFYYSRGASWSWADFNSGLRMAVSAERADSVLLFDWTFVVQTSVHHALHSWRLRDVTNSTYLDTAGGNLSNRNWVHAETRGSYNGDNAEILRVTAKYSPGTTNQIQYGLDFRGDSGNTYLSHSSADPTSPVGWRHSPMLLVYELEDV